MFVLRFFWGGDDGNPTHVELEECDDDEDLEDDSDSDD